MIGFLPAFAFKNKLVKAKFDEIMALNRNVPDLRAIGKTGLCL